MNSLSEIVKIINAILIASAFNTATFQKTKLFGITKTIPYKEKTAGSFELLPTELDLEGNGTKVIPDDNNPLQIYHKINSITTVPDKQQYGNANDKVIRTSQLSMIVWAQMDKIKMTETQLDQLLLSVFPNKLLKADLTRLQLTDAVINMASTDFNSMQIFAREYATKQYYFNPKHLFFEVKYSIECKLSKKCIKTC